MKAQPYAMNSLMSYYSVVGTRKIIVQKKMTFHPLCIFSRSPEIQDFRFCEKVLPLFVAGASARSNFQSVLLDKGESTQYITHPDTCFGSVPVAPVAYQVILEPGIGQFREFEPRRVHTRINSLGLYLVHKLTSGKRESVS